MTWTIALAVLVAAVTHAGWNALAHHIRDQLQAFTLVGLGGALAGGVLACLAPVPHAAAWPYLVGSDALHVAYMLLLMRAFGLGDFSQTYPVARGTAPLVVTVLAAVFLGEVPGPWQTAGVVLASCGLAGVALWGLRGGRDRPHRPALVAAVCTGIAIAAYTVVDGSGVRASGSPAGYAGWLLVLQGWQIPLYALLRYRSRFAGWLRPVAVRGLAGGVLSVAAYGLVLWAQTRGALAPISALRESSVIVGALIGTVFFKEPFGRHRVIGAAAIVAGIGLMLAGG